MIRGYFSTGAARRPFISAHLQFPAFSTRLHLIELLVDTGADRTLLSPVDVRRAGVDATNLPVGSSGIGVGGQAPTRLIEAVLTIETFSMPLTLPIPETPLPIPSLLGRDVLAHFALFMEERTQRLLLLEPAEADALHL